MFGMIGSDVFQSFPICHLMCWVFGERAEEEIILLQHNDIRHTTHSCQLPSPPRSGIYHHHHHHHWLYLFLKLCWWWWWLLLVSRCGVVPTSLVSSCYYLSSCHPLCQHPDKKLTPDIHTGNTLTALIIIILNKHLFLNFSSNPF